MSWTGGVFVFILDINILFMYICIKSVKCKARNLAWFSHCHANGFISKYNECNQALFHISVLLKRVYT